MNTRHDVVNTELSLRLVVPGSTAVPVVAAVRYETDDPYAIHVGFRTGSNEVVEWTFARQLLSDGVRAPIGDGDVRVWPAKGLHGQVVCLSLSSPSGQALFEVPMSGLVDFLGRTYAAVPRGRESDFVDLDAELALLVWGDSPL